MAGNQITGDGLSANLAGMSKNQLYDIMSQMKLLIEQNQDQAKQILIQNPLLTKALFQAQIMLGMVQPPQAIPNIHPTASQHPQQATQPLQQPNVQTSASTPPIRSQQQNPNTMPLPSASVPSLNSSMPSHPLQSAHLNAQTAAPPLPLKQPPSILQPTMPPVSTPLPQPVQMSNIPLLPLQPPLPSQPRPPSMQPFPHQSYSHMAPNSGYQHPQLHHSQPIFHSGSRPPNSMGPPHSQGPPLLTNHQPSQTLYQGGGSHVGMDFNQMGVPERGPGWMPGLSPNAAGPSPPFLPGQMSSANQPPRPAALTADMEKALLQQVMSLTPEQINLLPPEQRNQVLQLQQMLRQ